MSAFAELSERGDRIDVFFKYDPAKKEQVKAIPGARFVGRDKGGPLWRLPLDLQSGKALREVFPDLELGNALTAWGRDQVQKERNLRSLANAEDAQLSELVPDIIHRLIAGDPLPELGLAPDHPLSQQREERPYQRADIAMMAASNPANFNQPGTGKTLEWIGAVYESGLMHADGGHLVVNLVTAHYDPWVVELERLQPHPVLWGEDLASRVAAIERAAEMQSAGEPFWLIVGYDDIRWKEDKDAEPTLNADGKLVFPKVPRRPELFREEWATVVIDEAHKSGLAGSHANAKRRTLFNVGATKVRARKRGVMTGTPMGGKPRRLFPYFQWLEPAEFTSFWTWADRWLEVDENDWGGKEVGGLLPDREQEFYNSHARIMVRRLKREALPGMPETEWRIVPVRMTKKQAKQYHAFARDLELSIDEGRIAASNVLTEYTRLKQFANAAQTIEDGSPYPTLDSGKLPVLLAKLDEQGIRKQDPEPGARAMVASESRRFVEVVLEYLRGEGIAANELSGSVKGAERKAILDWYKEPSEEPRVLVLTTQTGGVSLNLEMTGSVHVLDETWNPDDMEQLKDRGERGSRTTALVVYVYRTEGTIQEYIAEVNEGKKLTNRDLLDLRQQGFRAVEA